MDLNFTHTSHADRTFTQDSDPMKSKGQRWQRLAMLQPGAWRVAGGPDVNESQAARAHSQRLEAADVVHECCGRSRRPLVVVRPPVFAREHASTSSLSVSMAWRLDQDLSRCKKARRQQQCESAVGGGRAYSHAACPRRLLGFFIASSLCSMRSDCRQRRAADDHVIGRWHTELHGRERRCSPHRAAALALAS